MMSLYHTKIWKSSDKMIRILVRNMSICINFAENLNIVIGL